MSAPYEPARLAVPVGPEDHARGPADASVTLVEYGDFECPNCAAAFPVVKHLGDEFKDDLRVVFRNFPLTVIHSRAMDAARAAEAAALQGAFWDMHDRLFLAPWALTRSDLVAHAEALDLDMEKFATDFGSEAVDRRIRADVRGGIRSGVNGTPTFFVNGIRHDGAHDFDTLAEAIVDARHAGARQRKLAW